MNFNNYTIKAQEAVQKAVEMASGNGQQAVETGHILKGVLEADENVTAFLLKKLNVNRKNFEAVLDTIIATYPKVSGSSPYLSNDANAALNKAASHLKDFEDEYVSLEHLFLGVLAGKDKTAQVM